MGSTLKPEPARCAWSNDRDPGTVRVEIPTGNRFERPRPFYVCRAHEDDLRRFVARADRQKTGFLAAIGAGVASALLPLFTESPAALAAPLLILGAALIAFPFAAPLTVARNGIAGSIRVLRAMGGVLIVFGLLFVGLAIG